MSTPTEISAIKNRFGIVGNNPRLLAAIEIARLVAPTEVTVLVLGENGTGKDAFSRIIHQFSRRKHKPFIAINCGAIPEGTMDSELFGHEKGSFTSAYEARKGYFEEVEGGTIFLDEIAEMPLATQSRLLRLLENGEYLRVGSSKVRKADVRVIAATNKNLVEMIRQGKFREDLYFRLNTVSIPVPPLRERTDDIEALFHFFALEFSQKYNRNPLNITDDAADMLRDYRWPGNIRELRNLAEKLTVLHAGNIITSESLRPHLPHAETYLPAIYKGSVGSEAETVADPQELRVLYKAMFDLRTEVTELKNLLFMGLQGAQRRNPETAVFVPEYQENTEPILVKAQPMPAKPMPAQHQPIEDTLSLEEKEKELIIRALRKHRNNRKKAASELGISERTLYRKLKSYGLDTD